MIVMNNIYDTTTTENTDPTDDKLLILNGEERLEYFEGTPDFRRKKNKVWLVIQYLRNLVKF